MPRKFISLSAALTAVLLVGASALAQEDSFTLQAMVPIGRDGAVLKQATIHVKDIDPSTPDGAKLLHARFEKAAKRLCGIHPDRAVPLYMADRVEACRQQALAEAVRMAGLPARE